MNQVVRQRARIARARRIQHDIAVGAAAQALGRVEMLEANADRLGRIRTDIQPGRGATDGAELARRGELAMRLDVARTSLGLNLDQARRIAAGRESERMAARRHQESAERLEQAASAAALRLAEVKATRGSGGRARRREGEEM